MATETRTKPYSGAGDPDLPDHVKKMSSARRRTWVRTFNGVMKGSGDEGRAMAIANNAAKMGAKSDDGDADGSDETAVGEKHDMPPQAEMIPLLSRPYGGATSFDEIDAYREANDQLAAVDSVVYDYRTLMENILADEEDDAAAKTGKLADLSDAFSARVRSAKAKDDGGAADKAGRRMGKPQLGMFTRALNDLKSLLGWAAYDEDKDDDEKAEWTTAFVNDLPDSAFLHVEPGGKRDGEGKTVPRSLRHFPYKDGSGDVDLPHLRNAIARAPQSSLPAAVVASVQTRGRRLLAAENKKEMGSFRVFRTKAGATRWLGISSNAFEDRERELFETKALEDAVRWADVTGDRGPLRVYHVPGADVAHCDFQAVVGRMLVESGTFDDTPLGRRAKGFFEARPDVPYGMSIGFYHEKGDEADGVYGWLRVRERSITPPGRAANPFTGFGVGGLPMVQITDDKKAFLDEVFGAEMAKSVIDFAESRSKELEAAGVRFKDDGEAGGAPPPEGDGDGKVDAPGDGAGGGEALEAMKDLVASVRALGEGVKALPALQEAVASLKADVAELKRSDDEKVAALMAPRGGPTSAPRPTQGAPNISPEDAATIMGKNKDDGTGDGPLAPGNEPVAPYLEDLYHSLGLGPRQGAAAS